MNAMQPPRWVERLLEATGADAEFTEVILGDLAEEFAIRIRYDDYREVRRWYLREATRTLPYLVRDALYRVRRGDALYMAKVVGFSHVATGIAVGILGLIASRMLATFGIDLGAGQLSPDNIFRPLGSAGMLAVLFAGAVLGGRIAARVGRRAPLTSVATLGLFWAALGSIGAAAIIATGTPVPVTSLVGQPLVSFAGAIVGGTWAVLRRDRERRSGTGSSVSA